MLCCNQSFFGLAVRMAPNASSEEPRTSNRATGPVTQAILGGVRTFIVNALSCILLHSSEECPRPLCDTVASVSVIPHVAGNESRA